METKLCEHNATQNHLITVYLKITTIIYRKMNFVFSYSVLCVTEKVSRFNSEVEKV